MQTYQWHFEVWESEDLKTGYRMNIHFLSVLGDNFSIQGYPSLLRRLTWSMANVVSNDARVMKVPPMARVGLAPNFGIKTIPPSASPIALKIRYMLRMFAVSLKDKSTTLTHKLTEGGDLTIRAGLYFIEIRKLLLWMSTRNIAQGTI